MHLFFVGKLSQSGMYWVLQISDLKRFGRINGIFNAFAKDLLLLLDWYKQV